MTQALVFTIPGKPVPKQRARKGKGAFWYTPGETRDYEHRVCLHGMSARSTMVRWPKDATYEVEILCVWSDRRRRDIDNVAKSVLDGLNGILWDDDSQVRKITVMRGEPERATRTVVRVSLASTVQVSPDPTEPFEVRS